MIVRPSSINDNAFINAARSLVVPGSFYSQAQRMGNNSYDCSSFVLRALRKHGIPVAENITTATMPTILPKYGLTYTKGLEGLRPGDILWKNGHTEIYTGDNTTIGAHSSKNGVSEYSYPGMLNQYAGYFRLPNQAAVSAPMSKPAFSSGSSPMAMQDNAPHEPVKQQAVPSSLNPSINLWSLMGNIINSNPYMQQMYGNLGTYINAARRFIDW